MNKEAKRILEEQKTLIEQCQLSSLYHEHRECFLSTWHRVVLFVIIMSSALLGSGFFRGYAIIESILALFPIILASSDLVFNFSTASQTHKFLRHRYSHLEARLVGREINGETLDEVLKEVTHLMAEEPPSYRALLYHCTNLVDLRSKITPTLKIPFYHMLFRNVFRFDGSQPRRIQGE